MAPTGMPFPITAMGAASALGPDLSTTLASLRARQSGLVPAGADDGLPFDTFTGRVAVDFGEAPSALGPHPTRQARLCAHLLDQIRPELERAKARWGAHRVAVLLGTTTGGMADTEVRYPGFLETGSFGEGYALETHHMLHLTGDIVGALAGVTGPVWVQSAACSSSNKVFGSARRLLEMGVADAVLVGGVDSWCRFTQLGFRSLEVLTSSRCTPFGADRSGINLGEGGALLLIEREGTPRAWVHGVGETSDAHHMTQPQPEGKGVAAAITTALQRSGLQPGDIDLVQAHATGTRYNDAAEAQAIARVLPHGPLVSATKGYTGHTLGACGALEAVFAVAALEEGLLPALASDYAIDPAFDIDLVRPGAERDVRFVVSLTAAFAGHNAAVILGAA